MKALSVAFGRHHSCLLFHLDTSDALTIDNVLRSSQLVKAVIVIWNLKHGKEENHPECAGDLCTGQRPGVVNHSLLQIIILVPIFVMFN